MDEDDKGNANDSALFPIAELPDFRAVRTKTRRFACKLAERPEPAAPDADMPSPDESEADFGFTRSTREEAVEFLRESQRREVGRDPLMEFLE